MLRSRILVALVGVPIGIALLVLGGWWFFGTILVLTLLGLHEYYTLVRPYRPNLLVGYVAGAAVIVAAYLGGVAATLGAFMGILLLLFLWGVGGNLGNHLVGRMAITVLGLVWVALGLAHVLLLRNLTHGLALTVLVVGASWLGDTFAYFTGRAIGRRKMAPRVSPNKTMEGAVGGLVGAVVFALGVKVYSDWLPAEQAIYLGLVAGFTAQWGDLFESVVKRDMQVKDSGRLLPGHGGILDRFDSVLFAGVAVYWACLLLIPDLVGGAPW